MPSSPSIVWFRQDLRLQDNPALRAAVERGGPVVPVYVHDDEADARWRLGGAARWWLHHSLRALDQSLRERGSRLIVLRGDTAELLREAIRATGATALYWNRCYEPAAKTLAASIKAEFAKDGVDAKSFNSALLHEPHTVTNKQGGPFQVFTPYWRHCLTLAVEAPVQLRPGALPSPMKWPRSASIDDLELMPKIDWAAGFREAWQPGEAGAMNRLRTFTVQAIDGYADERDLPANDGTSQLSPHLHLGEIGPRQIWAAIQAKSRARGVFPPNEGAGVFLNEIGWREFAHHLLFHFPQTPEQPLRVKFVDFPWAEDRSGRKLRAWQRGQTGYPIVDAGMRQLWRSGWMHNRVRMIVASFLVKHLRLSWQHGAEWFWDTLVDADLANNTLGWQWSAGCGADAAPYFRIFAPVTQGEKFDPSGDYVRRWIPELAQLPAKFIHRPWEAPIDVLTTAGLRLGENYPKPIVDHVTARTEALAAFQTLRSVEA